MHPHDLLSLSPNWKWCSPEDKCFKSQRAFRALEKRISVGKEAAGRLEFSKRRDFICFRSSLEIANEDLTLSEEAFMRRAILLTIYFEWGKCTVHCACDRKKTERKKIQRRSAGLSNRLQVRAPENSTVDNGRSAYRTVREKWASIEFLRVTKKIKGEILFCLLKHASVVWKATFGTGSQLTGLLTD